ncbi:thiopeptide-type bacteriocin biosynthesis protein [Asanoa ferruginea]|uniref:Thiopeptide-type bacteriocin biosynthesis protein n=1 Tax=Asanoa ferruginea TaxID=53367 RepID=A0A3D9ZSY5_9ACTN|nr:thiopeptide-type bacteriocin biosynthesis protein [Asanoa ferruginea]GIF50414.1 lantibiotic dehydratase [Asanoa ferruginea]
MGESLPKPDFRCADVLLVRVAARPLGWGRATTPRDGDEFGENAESLLDRIRELASDPVLREAVAVASSSLSRALDAALTGRVSPKQKDLRRLLLSLESYRMRMSTRATPFGLFAGVARARFEETGAAHLNGSHRTRARPDMGWLAGLVSTLETDPAVLPRLLVVTNASYVVRGGRLELMDRAGPAPQDADPEPVTSLRCTPAVQAALDAATTPIGAADLAELLTARWPGASASRSLQLLGGLVRHRLLLTDLRPPSECAEPIGHVLDRIGAHPAAEELGAIRSAMVEYDRLAPGEGLPVLERLTDRMRSARPADDVLHVDLAVRAEVRIPTLVARELEQAMETLWRLSPGQPGSPRLRGYHRDFLQRYGTGRPVPLTELLSEEIGLGLPDTYRRDGGLRAKQQLSTVDPDVDRNRLLARVVADAVANERREVCLDDDLVDRLAGEPAAGARPHPSIDVKARLMAPSMAALEAGDFRLAFGPYVGSSPAGAVSSRFATLLPDGNEEMGRVARGADEDTGDEIRAALVYRPTSDRTNNILTSPRWLAHHIAVGVGTFESSAVDLSPDDLAVVATSDQLVLVSRRLGRRVRPIRFNVANLSLSGTGMVRFLDDLGREGFCPVQGWNWGAMRDVPFLPRIRRGRTILALATWRIDDALAGPNATRPDWSRRLAAWREAAGVPQRIVVAEGDRVLTLDLDESSHRELFRRSCERRGAFTVREVLEDSFVDGWLRSPDGPHHCEIVVPMVRREPAPTNPVAVPPGTATQVRDRDQLHLPGGEWLYAKIYTSAGRLTELARDHLPALLERLAAGALSRWFFIRYADPGAHLRLRISGSPTDLWSDSLPRLRDWVLGLRQAGLVSHLALDSYDPEVERYGGAPLIEPAERVFHADSEAVIRMLRLLELHCSTADPVMVGALSVLHMFAAMGQEDEAADWLARTGANGDYRKTFTARREQALRLADPGGAWTELRQLPGGDDLLAAWDRRRPALADYRSALGSAGDPATPMHSIARSLAHMHCNRLFGLDRTLENQVLSVARNVMLTRARRARYAPR